jgi:hypothetical protein
MPDPIFDSLRDPAPVVPPDVSVIQRRGEQRKRRTAIATVVGVVAVAAAIVVPLAALTGGDKAAPPVDRPTPTRTVDGDWVRAIPAGFPLGAGIPMPGEATAQTEHGTGTPLQPCADGQSSLGQAGWTDVATATNRGAVDPSDGIDSRLLALYADDASAREALDSIARMYAACPGSGGGVPVSAEPLSDGSAWLLTFEEGSKSAGVLVTATRVGNALLVQQDALRRNDERSRDQQLADVRSGQAQVVAAMCVFAEAGC